MLSLLLQVQIIITLYGSYKMTDEQMDSMIKKMMELLHGDENV